MRDGDAIRELDRERAGQWYANAPWPEATPEEDRASLLRRLADLKDECVVLREDNERLRAEQARQGFCRVAEAVYGRPAGKEVPDARS